MFYLAANKSLRFPTTLESPKKRSCTSLVLDWPIKIKVGVVDVYWSNYYSPDSQLQCGNPERNCSHLLFRNLRSGIPGFSQLISWSIATWACDDFNCGHYHPIPLIMIRHYHKLAISIPNYDRNFNRRSVCNFFLWEPNELVRCYLFHSAYSPRYSSN